MRYDNFEHLLQDMEQNRPEDPAFIYEGEQGKKVCSRGQFASLVHKRAKQLAESGKTAEAVMADGSFACVTEIFAANLAGMQIAMMPVMPVEKAEPLLRYTDCDRLWRNGEVTEAPGAGVTGGKDRILFFTSGTTDSSKAVVLSSRSLMQSAYNGWAKLPLKEEDVLLNVLPLEHVFGFVCGLLWGVSSGCAVALGRGPRHYFDDLKYFHPTAVSVVPLLLGYLLKGAAINAECRLILVGAGDCPDELMAAVKAAGIRLAFGYGLTETSSGVAISVSGDARAMEICPDDTIVIAQDGEILISAPTCMMEGYYKREEDTRAVLRDGILYTGDLGYLDEDGRLHITGRKKEILVLPDGTKIFLPEYEALLSEYMGGTEYAVVVRNDRPVLVYHGKLSPEEVMEKITPFNITRPRSHQIVAAVPYGKALPRTQTGKVKRWQIQKEI